MLGDVPFPVGAQAALGALEGPVAVLVVLQGVAARGVVSARGRG